MEAEELNREEKLELLSIARNAVSHRLDGKRLEINSDFERLNKKRGVFVTIHKKGQLRGCIGLFTSESPLCDTIGDMALSAAFRDPRFSPLTIDEVEDVDFEISVLSPLRVIKDIDLIEVGKHGIYVTKGMQRGVLLPQVAAEYGWDVKTFLEQTCRKAGLPVDAWQQEGTTIEIFSAQVFGELEEEKEEKEEI